MRRWSSSDEERDDADSVSSDFFTWCKQAEINLRNIFTWNFLV